jgi:hypothetical protein
MTGNNDGDLRVLRLFNEKVDRLLATGLVQKCAESIPQVVGEFRDVTVEFYGAQGSIVGTLTSRLDKHNQDQIDAFALTYRLFIQKNDPVSIDSLAKIYKKDWMPTEAALSFEEAQAQMMDYMDSVTVLQFGTEHLSRRVLVDGTVRESRSPKFHEAESVRVMGG